MLEEKEIETKDIKEKGHDLKGILKKKTLKVPKRLVEKNLK